MTSTNYDDSKDRKTGGVNGIGVKAVNIYSNKFILET
jgi:DNA gyrase/topoisomerase IV subunit B